MMNIAMELQAAPEASETPTAEGGEGDGAFGPLLELAAATLEGDEAPLPELPDEETANAEDPSLAESLVTADAAPAESGLAQLLGATAREARGTERPAVEARTPLGAETPQNPSELRIDPELPARRLDFPEPPEARSAEADHRATPESVARPAADFSEANGRAAATPTPLQAPGSDGAEDAAPPPRTDAGATESTSTRAERASSRALPEIPVENENAVVREVQILARNGGGRARIFLEPPNLGELSVRVTVTGEAVSVQLIADRGQVTELLARHAAELRDALAAMGLRIDDLDVDAREGDDSARDRAWEQTTARQDGGRPRRPSAEAGGAADAGWIHQPSSARHLGAVDVRV